MNDYIICDNKARPYSFCNNEEIEITLSNAIESNSRTLKSFKELHVNHPTDKYFLKAYEDSKNRKFKAMKYDEYLKFEKDYLLNEPMQEIEAEEFKEALNTLPPLHWVTINGVNEFCLSEMYTGSFTKQYAVRDDKYYSKMVDCRDRSTWLHNFI